MNNQRYGCGFIEINNKWILLGGSNQLSYLSEDNDNLYQRGINSNYLKDCIMSIDNGLNWITICENIFNDNNNENFIGVFKPRLAYDKDLDLLYFCGGWYKNSNNNEINGSKDLWVSNNQGFTWKKIISNDNNLRNVLFAFGIYKSNLYIFGGADIDDNGEIVSSTNQVFISTNQGKDFNLLNNIPNLDRGTSGSSLPLYGFGYVQINEKIIFHAGMQYFIQANNARRQTFVFDFILNEFRVLQAVNNDGNALGITSFDNITHKGLVLHNEPILTFDKKTKMITMITGIYSNNYDTIYCAKYFDIINAFNENTFYPSVLWKKQYGLTNNFGLPSQFAFIRYCSLFSNNGVIYIVFGIKSYLQFNETDYPLLENTSNNLEFDINPDIILLEFNQIKNIYTNSNLLVDDNDINDNYPPSNHCNPPINGLLKNYQLLLPNYQVNQIYYSPNYYIECHIGNMPLIITVSHSGYKDISIYPNRNQNDFNFPIDTNNDNFTLQSALELKQKIFNLTGKYPYLIINNIPKSKLETNRHIHQKNSSKSYATNNTDLADSWFQFYHFINLSIHLIEKITTNHLIIDIHGHGRHNNEYQMFTNNGLQTIKGDFIHLGYLLSSNNLKNIYNKKITDIKFSTHYLYKKSNLSLYNFFYSNNSFGSYLHNNGLKTFPSNQYHYIDNDVPNQTYFTGGSITKIYASSWRLRPNYLNNTNVIQMEFPSSMRRNINRNNTTNILSQAIINLLDLF